MSLSGTSSRILICKDNGDLEDIKCKKHKSEPWFNVSVRDKNPRIF